jgi:hypothetical protein
MKSRVVVVGGDDDDAAAALGRRCTDDAWRDDDDDGGGVCKGREDDENDDGDAKPWTTSTREADRPTADAAVEMREILMVMNNATSLQYAGRVVVRRPSM